MYFPDDFFDQLENRIQRNSVNSFYIGQNWIFFPNTHNAKAEDTISERLLPH